MYHTGKQNRRAGRPPGEWLRLGLLAAVTAMFVARPLIPGEAVAEQGDGIPFVMLWILLAIGWLAGAVWLGVLPLRFGPADCALVVLVGMHAVSALAAVVDGSPRPAINMLWEWIAVGLGFVLVRQLIAGAVEARAMIAAMIALAVALSAMGFNQYISGLPQEREWYEKIKDDPEQMLSLGQWYPPGSKERRQFESRLYGLEATATFALANSLAAFLAPWFVVTLAIAALPPRDGPTIPRRLALIALAAVPIGGCLYLTDSRSSCLAALGGAALVWPVCRTESGTLQRKILAAGSAALVLLVIVAALLTGIGQRLMDGAGRSLAFRSQYWKSTLDMIGDYPVFGCGLGQFQDYYTAYKLPNASEEIQDPHNFLLEIWATAGTPAMLAMLALLGIFAWNLWRRRSGAASNPRTNNSPDRGTTHIWAGAVGGVLLATLLGGAVDFSLSTEYLVYALAAIVLGAILFQPWTHQGSLPPRIVGLGILVLLVNLMASGGIGYPSVAGSLWLLLAVGLNLVEAGRPARVWSRGVAIGVLGAMVLLAAACYFSAYLPVLIARGHLTNSRLDPREREELLVKAREADPFSDRIAGQLAEQRFRAWQEVQTTSVLDLPPLEPGDEDRSQSGSATSEQEARLAALLSAANEFVRLAPRSSTAWTQFGFWQIAVYHKTGDEARLKASVDAYRRAVALYPTSATLRGNLAVVLDVAAQDPEAQVEAWAALRLDIIADKAGHRDKRLSDELLVQVKRIADRVELTPLAEPE